MLKNDPKPDSRALRLLEKYDGLAERAIATGNPSTQWQLDYNAKNATTTEAFEYMKEKGVAFDVVSMDHDEAVEACFYWYAKLSKADVVKAFVHGVEHHLPDFRAGLSAFAMMQSLPRHSFRQSQAGFCEVCSAAKQMDRLDLTDLNRIRFKVGALYMLRTPYEIQFFLRCQSLLSKASVSKAEKLSTILATLRSVPGDATPSQAAKQLKDDRSLKLTLLQARAVLETLGLCGILESQEYPGYLTKYTNPGVAPTSSRSSDWAYPVDLWKGRDGVNEESLRFWFGEMGRS